MTEYTVRPSAYTIRGFSPSSKMMLERAKLSFDGTDIIVTTWLGKEHRIPKNDILRVENQTITTGSPNRKVLASRLIFVGLDSKPIISVPGGWVGSPRYDQTGTRILPGWWDYTEVLEFLTSANISLSETRSPTWADTFTYARLWQLDRPLAPPAYNYSSSIMLFGLWLLAGITIFYLLMRAGIIG